MNKPLAKAAQTMQCSESDLAFVEAIVRRAKTSFAHGMKILSPERRYGMYALYSFCRIVDDIADEGDDVPAKLRQLQEWREKIDRLFNGQAMDATERAIQAAIKTFTLRKEDFIALIDGMEMDVENPIVAPDEETLDLYCDRVASAVGRSAVRIFGDSSSSADQVAYHLGRALQLTNILRDLQEDAGRGRLYLPKELLNRFSIPLDCKTCLSSPYLQEICKIMAERARDHFRSARQAIALCDQKAMKPAKIMATTYAFLLAKQKRNGWRPPLKKISLSCVEKIMMAMISLIG